MNEKFNKNGKVHNFTTMLGIAVRLIVKDPSIPGLVATISEIGYLLLPSRDMAEKSLKRRKSSKQPTNNQCSEVW